MYRPAGNVRCVSLLGSKEIRVFSAADVAEHPVVCAWQNISWNAKVDDSYFLHRKPAIDETGKNLAFVLDEVDRHVMDARKHFRPPAAGDEESPKTIYDYVETKVKADPYVLAWVKFKPS